AQPGAGDSRRGRAVARRDLVDRRQDAEALGVEILLHAAAARALAEIRLRAVLAGEEAGGQRPVGNDAQRFLAAERLELGLVERPFAQIVVRLQAFIARQAVPGADRQRRRQPLRREVR